MNSDLNKRIREALNQAFALNEIKLIFDDILPQGKSYDGLTDGLTGEKRLQIVVDYCLKQGLASKLLKSAAKRNKNQAPQLRQLDKEVAEPIFEAANQLKADVVRLEKIVRPEIGFENFSKWLDKLKGYSGSICRIEPQPPPEYQGYGTGFLIGENKIMTARHVVADCLDENKKSKFRCRFDFLSNEKDGALYEISKVAIEDADLDLAVLDIKPCEEPTNSNEQMERQIFEFDVSPIDPSQPDPLLILQHPDARSLELCFGSSVEVGENELVTYEINTEGGSSGSPCLGQDLKVRAVHLQAVETKKQNQGRSTKSFVEKHNLDSVASQPTPEHKETIIRRIKKRFPKLEVNFHCGGVIGCASILLLAMVSLPLYHLYCPLPAERAIDRLPNVKFIKNTPLVYPIEVDQLPKEFDTLVSNARRLETQKLVFKCSNVLTDEHVNAIATISSLLILDLNVQESLKDISSLSELNNLTELTIGGSQLENDAITTVGQLQTLELLTLKECGKVRDLSALESNAALTQIEISNCGIEKGVSSLSDLQELEHLRIIDCHELDEDISLLRMPNFDIFEIENCPVRRMRLDTLGLTRLNIKGIQIDSCAPYGEGNLLTIVKLNNLETFKLSSCPKLKDIRLSQDGVSKLETLHISSNKSLEQITLKNLKSLSEGYELIAKSNNKLESLELLAFDKLNTKTVDLRHNSSSSKDGLLTVSLHPHSDQVFEYLQRETLGSFRIASDNLEKPVLVSGK